MRQKDPERRKNDAAAAAWLKSRENGADARLWLMRAARLAPEDPRIALELAQAELKHGNAAAAAAGFSRIAKRYDIAAAWMGLALAHAQANEMPQAAQALDKMLTRHCFAPDPGFADFALHTAQAAGYGGFQGVTAARQIIRHGAPKYLAAKPDLAALARVEGLVAWDREGLTGWAARPAAPETPPALWLTDHTGARLSIAFGKILPADDIAPFLPRHGFRVSPAQLRKLTPPFSLAGADSPQIFGSPIDPAALAQKPIPAKRRGKPPAALPKRARLALLMPVYRGLAQTQAALNSVLAAAPAGAKIIVIDDCTPEPALARWLDKLAAEGRISLRRHSQNQGFCAAVNSGLQAAKNHDILLLNADILLPPGAIETLLAVAYADAATGTVTPLSNEASICSYPSADGNPMPNLRETARLNTLAHRTNGLAGVEIPSAVGFCMFIRHDCLAATGHFRRRIFAQGYGEENDFSLRARHLGFRHMAAAGAFVAHEGGVSFRAAARGLMARNLSILNDIFPGYHELVQAHAATDPLKPLRAALDQARLIADAGAKQSILLISHSHGGGVARQVAADMAQYRAQGLNPLLLTTHFPKDPRNTPYPWPALLCTGEAKAYPNLVFTLPEVQAKLLALAARLRVKTVVLHHTLGHHDNVRRLAALLGVPQDIVVHDYASFCPRVNLLNRPDKTAPLRYCGEPAIAGCIACVKLRDGGVMDATPVAKLRARSAAEFAAAASVTVPSADAARRLRRHFPALQPTIRPWENDSALPPLAPPRRSAKLRIAVIGGIGPAKGFDLLLECAADATRRNLPLQFIVIGGSADDDRLLEAGIFVTGHYREGEAGALLAALEIDLAFLPSIWPETWCFALGEAWSAGLRAVVFALGAQGERMAAVKRGMALPLGLPAERINAMLMQQQVRAF